jgi:ribonuclease VapC
LAASQNAGIGAPTVVESSLVLCSRLGHAGKTLLARFLQEAEIEIAEFTADHWTVAADAFIAFGKGRHRAGLNFGDCMTYAVAKLAGEPLLCLGDDFPATDLELA